MTVSRICWRLSLNTGDSMLKMICLDLDGTLLNSESKVNPLDRKAINKCIDNKVRIAISTGKSYGCVYRIIRDLGLKGFQVASNGAAVINEGQKPVWTNKIPRNIYISLISYLREKNRSFVVHHLDGHIYCEESNQYLKDISNTGEIITRTENVLDQRIAGEVLMLTYDGKADDEVHKRLIDLFNGKLNIRTGAPFRMDVYSIKAGKSNAIRKILKMYGISREELMAVGDSENDIEMINLAGLSIAMGNSPDSVKSIADFVVADNNNNGVSEAINKYFFNNNRQ